jgi:hypothetical protein|tara:strand:- start:4022 stop:4456 length:435 start_codon:yes stop_codon:yes gene_type:complete
MQLKNLIIDSKSAWVDFPGLAGFSVEVVNLSRKELQGLRKRCTTQKLDRKTRHMEEVLDEEKFVSQFSKLTIRNWKGLTLQHLETLILIDTTDKILTTELPWSEENAEILVSQSSEFDTWLNEVVFDLDNFRTEPKGDDVETAG